MEKLPKLNERLITKALEHIKKFPEAYDQQLITGSIDKTKDTPCGAVGCFGGWIKLLSIPKGARHDNALHLDENNTLVEAGKMVGFTEQERDYVFATTDHQDPEVNYKIIVGRLQQVRIAREKILKSKYYRGQLLIEEAREKGEDSMEVQVNVRNDDEVALDYSHLVE